MDRLWAPWRMEYISGASAQAYPEGACVLCLMGDESPSEENLILHRGTVCYIIMNLFPFINRPPDGAAVPPYSMSGGFGEGGTP